MRTISIIKKAAVKATIVIMLLSFMAPGALAAFKANVYTSGMKVYKSPSTSAKLYGTLGKGAEFSVLAFSKGWARISYKGKIGYAQIKDMASQKRVKGYAKVDAKVYEGASSSSEKLGTIEQGTAVYAVGINGDYLLVENRSGKISGYINKKYVGKKKPVTKNPVDEDPEDGDDPDDGEEPAIDLPSGLKSTTDEYYKSMSNAQKIEYAIYVAQNQMGKPYSSNPNPPSSYDCAGLVRYCFEKIDIDLEASAYDQGYDSTYEKISSPSSLKRGDVVCFDTNENDGDLSDHTGIYIVSGYFIHASSSGKEVIVSNLNSGYYSRTFSWGRRILD